MRCLPRCATWRDPRAPRIAPSSFTCRTQHPHAWPWGVESGGRTGTGGTSTPRPSPPAAWRHAGVDRMWGGGDRWCMAGARARSRTHGRRCVRPRRLRRLVPSLLRGLRGSPARDGRRHPGSCWPFCVRPLEALHVPRVPRRPACSPSPTTMPFLQSTGRAVTRSGGRWEQRRTRTTCPLAKMVALIAHGDDRPAATPPSTSPTSLLLLHLPLLRLYPGAGRHDTRRRRRRIACLPVRHRGMYAQAW